MSILKLSKSILDVLYYIGLSGVLLILVFFILYNLDYNIEDYIINLPEYNNLSAIQLVYFVTPFSIIALVLYVLIIRNFRKIIVLFYNEVFFGLETSEYLNQIGIYLIVSMFLWKVPPFVASLFSNPSVVRFSLPIGFDSSISLIAIGLFFIALSEIFKKALKIKQENDLTI
jgi:hypothetical protein